MSVPSKPPVTTANALLGLVPGTAMARRPVRALGRAMVVPQAMALGLKLSVGMRFKVTELLVPPEVVTVTVTEAAVSVEGTVTTTPVADHAEVAGVTSVEEPPWVKVTLPGAPWKLLPLISMG